MSTQDTTFYRNKKAISFNFSSNEISSDGAVLLLEKIERKFKIIKHFSKTITDARHQSYVKHDVEKLLKQRVFLLMAGYEDANDVEHLKDDPLYKDILQGDLASQPTISRFENSLTKADIFNLCYAFIDRYVSSLKGRKKITIDIDATDDPTHGTQQYTLFNGFYGQFMYNELFFHDGDTGQIILPVLRPGNSHSNKWYVAILRRVLDRIRAVYPDIEITIRADSGFSCVPFYTLANNPKYNLKYAVGIAANDVLKKKSARVERAVNYLFVQQKKKHQHFIEFQYKAQSWEEEQNVYAKVESTGKGLNVRYFVSNIEEKTAREIYLDFYVKRGEHSENRIKEVKNMCFSDRLSNHKFWPNFFRLFISSIAYEMFLYIKGAIKKTKFRKAWKWQISTIRVLLLKVGATIRITKKRVYYLFSKAFVYQELMRDLLLC